jgi:hypothetical protein
MPKRTIIMLHEQVDRPSNWISELRTALPLFGHRNWVVVADSAYPLQSNPGITTILADAEHLEVVRFVLGEIAASPHIRPVVYMDRELASVPEQDAGGIEDLRRGLASLVPDALTLNHEEIISRLDQAAKLFRILIIKTALPIPYTSVFIELDCGYWNTEAEQRLREAMHSGQQRSAERT